MHSALTAVAKEGSHTPRSTAKAMSSILPLPLQTPPSQAVVCCRYTDVKRKEDRSTFIRPHEGLFGLREWLDEGVNFKVPDWVNFWFLLGAALCPVPRSLAQLRSLLHRAQGVSLACKLEGALAAACAGLPSLASLLTLPVLGAFQDPIEDKFPDESTQAVLRRNRISSTQQLARANSRGSNAGHRGRSHAGSPAYDPFLPSPSQVSQHPTAASSPRSKAAACEQLGVPVLHMPLCTCLHAFIATASPHSD